MQLLLLGTAAGAADPAFLRATPCLLLQQSAVAAACTPVHADILHTLQEVLLLLLLLKFTLAA